MSASRPLKGYAVFSTDPKDPIPIRVNANDHHTEGGELTLLADGEVAAVFAAGCWSRFTVEP